MSVWLFVGAAFLCAWALVGCKKTASRADMAPLDQAGMWANSVEQLRQIKLADSEVKQLATARQAGLDDSSCVELVRIARSRQQVFSDGTEVANLANAGMGESSILELDRLNELTLWGGEAQALRLAGLSDNLILTVARRLSAGQSVLSSAKIAALRNAGLSEKEIIDDIQKGTTDAEADKIVYLKNYYAGGHSFVRQRGRRR